MNYQHKSLAQGRWYELSLAEQMGNIGSEISRALRWQNKNESAKGNPVSINSDTNKKLFENAIYRALELLDLTIADPRLKHRLKELTRVREVICDAFLGGTEYKSSLKDLDKYFFHFALASRNNK